MPKHILPALAVLVKKPFIFCMALGLLFFESSRHAIQQLRLFILDNDDDGKMPQSIEGPSSLGQNRSLREDIRSAFDLKKAETDGRYGTTSSDMEEEEEEDDDEISSDYAYISSLPQDIMNFRSSETPSCFHQVIVRIWPRSSTARPQMTKVAAAACQGLLLRDDLVLTTAYCAATAASVQIPIVSRNKTVALLATTDANADQPRSHPLGLLKVDLLSYHRNSGIPRKRMFLGKGSISNQSPLHCKGSRPIAVAVPVSKSTWVSVFPVQNLVAAKDVLWDDDIDSASELTNGKRKWWVARQSKDVLSQAIIDLGKDWLAPPGSGSVDIVDHTNLGPLLEAEDPRGHRFHMCFTLYHQRWIEQVPFSGVPFYDWLDFGGGKNITPIDYDTYPELRDKGWGIDCPKEKFNARKLHYLNSEERKQYAVNLTPYKNGELVRVTYQENGAPIDDEKEVYLYVLSIDRRLYVIPDAHQSIGHSTLIASEPALAAGELLIGKKGRLEEVDFGSGHYRGGVSSFIQMHNWMVDLGLNTMSVEFELRSTWNVTAKSKRSALRSGKRIFLLEGSELSLVER